MSASGTALNLVKEANGDFDVFANGAAVINGIANSLSKAEALNLIVQAGALVTDAFSEVNPVVLEPANIVLNITGIVVNYNVLQEHITKLGEDENNPSQLQLDALNIQGDCISVLSNLTAVLGGMLGPAGGLFNILAAGLDFYAIKITAQVLFQQHPALAVDVVDFVNGTITKAENALTSTSQLGHSLFGDAWNTIQSLVSNTLNAISTVVTSNVDDPNFLANANAAATSISNTQTTITNLAGSSGVASQTVTATGQNSSVSITTNTNTFTATENTYSSAQNDFVYGSGTFSEPATGNAITGTTATAVQDLTAAGDVNTSIMAQSGTSSASLFLQQDASANTQPEQFVLNATTITVAGSDFAEFNPGSDGSLQVVVPSANAADQVTVQSEADGSDQVTVGSGTGQELFDFSPDGGAGSPAIDISTSSQGTLDIAATMGAADNDIVEADYNIPGVVQDFQFGEPDDILTIENPGSFAGTISNFLPSDTLDLAGLGTPAGVTLTSDDILLVQQAGGGSVSIQLDPAEDYSNLAFVAAEYLGDTLVIAEPLEPSSGSQTATVLAPVYDPDISNYVTYSAMVALQPTDITFAAQRAGDVITQELPVTVTFSGGNLDPSEDAGFVDVSGGSSSDGLFSAQGVDGLGPDQTSGSLTVVEFPEIYNIGDFTGDTIPLTVSYDGSSTDVSLTVNGMVYAPAEPIVTFGDTSSSIYDFGVIHVGQTASIDAFVTNGVSAALADSLSSSAGTDGIFTARNAVSDLAAGQSGTITLSVESDVSGIFTVDEAAVFNFASHDAYLPDEAIAAGTFVTAEVYNYAQPILLNGSYELVNDSYTFIPSTGATAGTLTQDGNAWNLDFGAVSLDTTTSYLANILVDNAAPEGESDALGGSITSSGGGFISFALPDISPTPAGFSAELGDFTPDSTALGTHTLTIEFQPLSIDSTGTTALPTITLTVTDDVVACFAAGTRLATPDGDIAVEHLRVGDRVRVRGGLASIQWIGHRSVACRSHRNPPDVWPVRIRADAFGPGEPHHDLWLSSDHAVFTAGVLIPIRRLINGTTIVQEPWDAVTYWHIELERHDVVYAEGLPAESYLDTGNRAMFANTITDLHPAFAREANHAWATRACALLAEDGPTLAAARCRLAARATELGFDRARVAEIKIASAGHLSLTVPADAHSVHLVSPSARRGGDRRRLGALVRGIRIDGAALALHDARLGSGFHAAEVHGRQMVRWTDGNATVQLGRGAVERRIEIDVASVIVERAA